MQNGPLTPLPFWPPSINLTSTRQFLERLKEVNQMATQVLRSLDQTLGGHRCCDCFLGRKINAPRRIRNIHLVDGLLLGCGDIWAHLAPQTKSLFSIWLVCTAFNWCNDVLPTILLEQKTPPLICSGSLNESCTAYVHFQVLRTSFLLSSFHLLSSIDLHKT